MGYNLTLSQKITTPGKTVAVDLTITAEDCSLRSPTVPVAKTGTLSSKTDADTGVAAMTAGHGFITGDKLDVFWATGARRGMTATVASNNVTIDGGTGDNLPIATTALTVMKPVSEVLGMSGDDVVGISVDTDRKGFIVFAQADGTVIKAYKFGTSVGGNATWFNDSTEENPLMASNPLAGVTVGKVLISHDDSTATHTPTVAVYHN